MHLLHGDSGLCLFDKQNKTSPCHKKEWNNKVIVELQTTRGTTKAGYLTVIKTTTVQENQLTMVNPG